MPYRRLGFSDRLSTTVRDVAGALADPGAFILKIKDPTGTVTPHNWAGDITRDGLGLFHFDLAGLTTLGPYQYKWNATGANTGVSPNPRYFTLVDEWTPILLTLEEAKSQLNAAAPDADLELYIDSATEAMERRIGPIVPQVVTKRVLISPDDGHLLAPTHIVSDSVTAATQNGSAVSVTGWTTGEWGRITPGTQRLYGDVIVTYKAGFDPIPTPLKEAAALRGQHSYATQRGGRAGVARIIGGASEDIGAGPDGSDFLLMIRAREKEDPYVFPAVA
jgi:hypothetical protein